LITPSIDPGYVKCPALETWLTRGGDDRIECNPHGLNAYGYPPHPLPDWHGFSACTASVISPSAWEAARLLHERLPDALTSAQGFQEWARIGSALLRLNGLDDLAGLRLVFAASGTDAHGLAARLTRQAEGKMQVTVMADPAETGSRILDTLRAATGGDDERLVTLPVRQVDGSRYPVERVDAAFEAEVEGWLKRGYGVRLIVLDVSKTGLTVPGRDCVVRLKRCHGPDLATVVDASQFRLSTTALRTYLTAGCLVILTGSKFLGGPAFSGVLLLPAEVASGKATPLIRAMSRDTHSNRGLLLRWEAALSELERLRQRPEQAVMQFKRHFIASVSHALMDQTGLALLDEPVLEDEESGILAFWLRERKNGRQATEARTRQVFDKLQNEWLSTCPGFSLGQPVRCGQVGENGRVVLRLALSAPLVCAGVDDPERVIAWALQGLARLMEPVYR
jgi:hypothetical protein